MLAGRRYKLLHVINRKKRNGCQPPGRNLHDLRQIEKALRTSELSAAIVESSDDGIIGLSLDGNVRSWNPGAERIYGYSAREMLGRSISVIIPTEKHTEFVKLMENTKAGKHVTLHDTICLRKDGKTVEVSINASPIKDSNGKIVGISSITRDITEHKRLEKEMARLDRLNLVGEMAAAIGHEVRNPMTTVRGFLQLLGARPEFKHYGEYFSIMIEELDRANFIISEFLSLHKKRAVEMKNGNLNSILEALFPLIEAGGLANDKYVKLELSPVPDFNMNEKEIRQLILNLARNGFEAMSSGETLTIKTCLEENRIVLMVRDQGPGIPQEVMEKLGTPFFSTKDRGTGLGLAVCYSIAARHNAVIDIDTGPTGTTFSVRFSI